MSESNSFLDKVKLIEESISGVVTLIKMYYMRICIYEYP